jgi:uncharacterized protein YabE (DUF348 family)
VIIALILALWSGYVLSGQPVTLVINGQPHSIRAHSPTVEALTQELGLTLKPEDIIQPPPDSQLAPGATVTIQLARPVLIEADGRTWSQLTHHQTVATVLAEADLTVTLRDKILLNGKVEIGPTAPLPSAQTTTPAISSLTDFFMAMRTPRGRLASARPESVQLIIRRAIPITVHDGHVSNTIYTTQPNVGEALLEQGWTLFLGDQVTPSLGARLSPGMRIYVQRSTPVAITVDGRLIKTRTRRETIAAALAQEGVVLMGQDYSRPPPNQPITADELIEVVRVREDHEIEEEFIPFETTWIADAEMELDQQAERQKGVTGVIKSRTRIRYENDQEVWHGLEDEWLDQEPNDRVIAYGTKIVVRTLDTPDGPIEYWRRIAMLLTPYTAATSGKDASDPLYGITRSGLRVAYGMAAVDPKVIPLGTTLYVPGYGKALAADTGGLVLGKHIDLAFEEHQAIPDLYGWGDVYILTPVPPADNIRYVLPQWPQR